MLFSLIGLEEAATEAAETTNQMGMFDNLFSLIMVAAGVYAIYSAITGKGAAFRKDYPASMQKEATELLQKFLWIIGPAAVISGVLDFIVTDPMYEFWPYIGGLIVILPTIVIYVVMFRRKFREDLKRMR